ncbi:serine/threonine protein kinase with WD40 repeats [Anaeromyxobacter dehalogenans 2CP-1]|uniref:Serine/threonine protein kinase with WD40 repeats n=1 Tax=Anaeromyxobacter dehalogenans (strain ATCC BAA-258 / DSM 21875 / 2CP-1) TaxID=455488 RepID=B8J635_ANAD2|nr:protein kinase [Anaeromyxobacter dehalogenans]ACL66930.1 serine/threonine protein kinase with WD40 repeats [Anaeromyxobacter dehalogenans 2CP-1]
MREAPRAIPPELEGESQELSDLLLELASAPARDPSQLAAPLEAGMVVGRFELLREIGRGGFGLVFEARDRELGRLVAFKAMRPSRAEPAALEKPLREEAEAAARLNHPNVVTLHDFGIHEGTPYLILELLRGETLQQRLKRGRLPPEEAVRIARDVASGLVHAHSRGVLHRDLKPGNVFLTEGGGVKLLDFGLARLLDRASLAGGTPAYMAPEQLRGEPGDARADVFSAGVVLWQMLTGELPFPVVDGRSTVLDPGPPPRLPLEDAPPSLASLLTAALSKAPTGRPQTALGLLDGLGGVEQAYAGRAVAQARAARLRRLRRTGTAAGGLVVLGLAAAAALAIRSGDRAERALRAARVAGTADGASDPLVAALLMAELPDDPPPRAVAIAQRLLSEPIPETVLDGVPKGEGLAVSPDGAWVAAGGEGGGARLWRADGTGAPRGLGADGPARTDGLAFTPDGRRLVTADHAGTLRVFPLDGGGAPRTLPAGGVPLVRLALDPAGRIAAAGALDGRLWLADLAGDAPPRSVVHDGAVLALAFSPDGTRVATGTADGFVRVIASPGGAVLATAPLPGGVVWSVAWSPDGRLVAVGSEDGVVRLLGPDGRVRQSLGAPGLAVSSVAFDRAGTRVVAGSQDGAARVWRLGAAVPEVRLRGHRGSVAYAAFAPDGRRVVTGGTEGTVRIWPADGEGSPVVLRGHTVVDGAPTPDGSRLFTRGTDDVIRVWRTDDPRQRGQLVGHEALVDTVQWTRDGTRVLTASHDGTARLWPVHGGAALTVRDPGNVIHSADLDPTERTFVTSSEDRTVRVWDAATGALVRELRGHDGPVLSAAFSPDGTLIASGSLDKTVRVWRADGTGTPLVFRGHGAVLTAVTWTPDGKAVISSSQDEASVHVWPLDGSPPRVVRAGRPVFRAAVAPDGTLLVPEQGGALRRFSPDGEERAPFPALPEGLFSVAVSRDGRRWALASSDGTVRVYPRDGSGDPLVLRAHDGAVGNAAFSPDGTELATVSADGTARVSTVDWGRLRAALRAATSACLPVAHRIQVLGEARVEAERRFADCETAHGRVPPPRAPQGSP